MKKLVLAIPFCLMLALPGLAQSTITLDDIDVGGSKPSAKAQAPAGAENDMETCLLNQASCKNKEFKPSASFSIDDVVNLGIVDREAVKPQANTADAAAALPSIDMEILFDYDSADLRPDQFAKLTRLSDVLKGEKFAKFRLLFLGHSDAKGSADYNRKLSQQRARAVAGFVGGQANIPSDRIIASGLGSSKLKDVSDPFGPQNRRVQLVLVPAN